VRAAVLFTTLVGVSGLLLVVAGVVDLHWWAGSDASRLSRIFQDLKNEYGVEPPELLRRGGDAVQLILLGLVCLALAGLTPLIARGRSWARTCGVVLGLGAFIVGLIGVGGDAVRPVDLKSYLHTLAAQQITAPIPGIEALVHPVWYGWIEDAAQGLQVLFTLGAVISLAACAISYPEFFTTKRGETAAPDAWDSAITRIREQNRRDRDPE
jgi:hypothetical protein